MGTVTGPLVAGPIRAALRSDSHLEALVLPGTRGAAVETPELTVVRPNRRPGARPGRRGPIALAGDVAALVVAAMAAGVLEHVLHPGLAGEALPGSCLRLLVAVPLMAAAVSSTRARRPLRSSFGHHLGAVAPALAAGGLLCMAIWGLADGAGLPWALPTDSLLVFCGAAVVSVPLARTVLQAPRRQQGRRARRVVIVGSGLVATRVAEYFTSTGEVEVLGFVDDDPCEPVSWVGKLGDLADIAEREAVDHIVVAFSRASPGELIDALRPVLDKVPVTVVPRLFDVLPSSAVVQDLGSGLTGISLAPATLGRGSRMLKRTIDLVGAVGALVVMSPLLVAVAVVVKLSSPGPVLFRQERTGRDGRRFRVIKFRSMVADDDARLSPTLRGDVAHGPFPKLRDDPRVTPVGRFIRRTSIDELPQLWNVLKGEMSLVGPRPFIPEEAALVEGWAQVRLAIRPGITGLWQVSGRNHLTFQEMCRLDSQYVTNWSLGLDLRILARTLRPVLSRSGAF